MTNDTKWIIGTVIALAGLLAAQIATQIASTPGSTTCVPTSPRRSRE